MDEEPLRFDTIPPRPGLFRLPLVPRQEDLLNRLCFERTLGNRGRGRGVFLCTFLEVEEGLQRLSLLRLLPWGSEDLSTTDSRFGVKDQRRMDIKIRK